MGYSAITKTFRLFLPALDFFGLMTAFFDYKIEMTKVKNAFMNSSKSKVKGEYMKLIPITSKQELHAHGIFLSRERLLKLWRSGRYPGLIKKVFGRIYVDVELIDMAINTTPRPSNNNDGAKKSDRPEKD